MTVIYDLVGACCLSFCNKKLANEIYSTHVKFYTPGYYLYLVVGQLTCITYILLQPSHSNKQVQV